jgi:hypothetical protein
MGSARFEAFRFEVLSSAFRGDLGFKPYRAAPPGCEGR